MAPKQKRHRGKYSPSNPAPFELSRSKIWDFTQCPACFWLEKAKGVKKPSIPQFLLNSNTDRLLKRDFDRYRGQSTVPILEANGLGHLIPFKHDDLEKWITAIHFGASPQHFNTVHEETNLLIGGGLDDVLIDPSTKVLTVIDYKSTSNQKEDPQPVSLEGKWKVGYKRQMDMYVWILRRKGFEVSDITYFLYVDGQHKGEPGMLTDPNPTIAWMKFNTSVLPYETDTNWIEGTLHEVKACLLQSTQPSHTESCEFGKYLEVAALALLH